MNDHDNTNKRTGDEAKKVETSTLHFGGCHIIRLPHTLLYMLHNHNEGVLHLP